MNGKNREDGNNINITVNEMLINEFIWKKERVQIEKGGKYSIITRLEFQYEAIDHDYKVSWIEPDYDEIDGSYLIIHCED